MSAARKTSVKYSLKSDGYFVIEDYNRAEAFSSFFPGVAGLWGIPMWVFYVNRGQCIASFGIESKNKAIMEFQPANKSYRQVPLQGFRTFIKLTQGKKAFYWEPFQNHLSGTEYAKTQSMRISAHDLILEEHNEELGLTARVHYYTIPDEPFSGLIRRVSIVNTGGKTYTGELIDGMPTIVPFGLSDWLIKNLARTTEAWIKVRNLEHRAPFYQLNVEVADTPQVTHITEGNFFFSLNASSPQRELLPPLVEASHVFGACLDFSAPEAFLNGSFKPSAVPATNNKTPSAMTHCRFELPKGGSQEIVSVVGYARDVELLNRVVEAVRQKDFADHKQAQNREIVEHIKDFAQTVSSSSTYNAYAGHTFLDNILRGGLPISVKTQDGFVSFNVYSRKHGDLERDYNHFTVAPTYFSQGNGNYRDVNQNRRNDIWFNTDVRDSHIINFLNLSQADGYNPLVVKGTSFRVDDKGKLKALLDESLLDGDRKTLEEFVAGNFQPGELLDFMEKNGYRTSHGERDFLGHVLEICHMQEMADHGEGFWSDHWTYNLDLIESYLGLYPERLRELLLESEDFSFYLNHHYVRPRDQRYHLTKFGVRQYDSVCDESEEFDPGAFDHKLRVKGGQGAPYLTNLLVKLVCIIANKVASLDPSGIGVEMEADKPNWYDALNGLPGLTGSSISETMELNRYAGFLLDSLKTLDVKDKDTVPVFEELASFVSGLTNLLTSKQQGFDYWSKANDIKENYRQRVRRSIDGKEVDMTMVQIKNFLDLVKQKTGESFQLAHKGREYMPTYFYHEVSEYKQSEAGKRGGNGFVKPLAFQRHDLPPFLEGYVHALKVQSGPDKARALLEEVCQGPLFDEKLKMFKVNADLSGQTEEIGRTRIFPRGWLENESIWLHMEYKFLLEVLRAGLVEDFYRLFADALIPFQKPARYGRSILENSSFIVSSAHEDSKLHGQGFVARLSGSTAEFLHIWLHMNIGGQPFRTTAKDELSLAFEPALAEWLFTKKPAKVEFQDGHGDRHTWKLPADSYAFKFLNSTLVVYHNPQRKDTFGPQAAKPERIEIRFRGEEDPVTVSGGLIQATHAARVRDREACRIDVHLA